MGILWIGENYPNICLIEIMPKLSNQNFIVYITSLDYKPFPSFWMNEKIRKYFYKNPSDVLYCIENWIEGSLKAKHMHMDWVTKTW